MPTNDHGTKQRRSRWGFGQRSTPDAASAPAGPAQLVAPAAGTAIPLAEVDDAAFAAGLLGPGLAVQPSSGEVVSPVTGTVVTVMPHAYGLRSESGVEVLVHVGIDTVSLQGRHFDPQVAAGERVTAGQPLVRVDLSGVVAAGLATTVMLVVTNAATLQVVDPHAAGAVQAGQPVISVVA